MKKSIFLSLFIVLIFVGCQRDPKPRNTVDQKVFIDLLVDTHVAEAMFIERNGIKIDSLQSKSLYLSVLKKYNVTEKEFENTIIYYSRHPKDYDKIYTEVLSKIAVMTEELQGKKEELQKQ